MNKRKSVSLKRKSVFIRTAALVIPVILLLLLSQTAFARNTYVITDGDRVLVHTTATTDPKVVLNEAGLALGEDDTYTTQAGLGVSEITIQRSYTVTIDNCGNVLEVNSTGETVEELLNRLSIFSSNGANVSVPLDSRTYDGMQIKISSSVNSEEVYTISIPHEVTYCYDDSIPEGEEVILTKGVDGQMSCTARVVYSDGVELSRELLDESIVQQPVTEVIAVGTGSAAKAPLAADAIEIGEDYILLPSGERLPYSGTIHVEATAYTHTDAGCDFYTSTGTYVEIGTVAVDPRLIPYGTRMFIISDDGEYVYGLSTAEDCGGDIKNQRIDLYFPTYDDCIQFGRRDCTIYVIGDAELERLGV